MGQRYRKAHAYLTGYNKVRRVSAFSVIRYMLGM